MVIWPGKEAQSTLLTDAIIRQALQAEGNNTGGRLAPIYMASYGRGWAALLLFRCHVGREILTRECCDQNCTLGRLMWMDRSLDCS